jgi:SAM-dependent methyltransferase
MTAQRHAPATARNRGPLLDVLRRVLPQARGGRDEGPGLVLEIASGSGEHVVHFAAALPGLQWLPSDIDDVNLASIAAWIAESGCGTGAGGNVHDPIRLDATAEDWPVSTPLDVIFNANMIHIAPWSACVGLLRGAGRHLVPRGLLILYGPYRIGGQHTAASNAAFDLDLRGRNPSWGVRDLEAVVHLASDNGLALQERVEMPANNQTLIFQRA